MIFADRVGLVLGERHDLVLIELARLRVLLVDDEMLVAGADVMNIERVAVRTFGPKQMPVVGRRHDFPRRLAWLALPDAALGGLDRHVPTGKPTRVALGVILGLDLGIARARVHIGTSSFDARFHRVLLSKSPILGRRRLLFVGNRVLVSGRQLLERWSLGLQRQLRLRLRGVHASRFHDPSVYRSLWFADWSGLRRYWRTGRSCLLRSEARRVGKECRSRWSPYH